MPATDLPPARNRRIRQLFDAASEIPPDGQADFLWRECGEDEELVRAVWRLLSANRKNAGFLDTPAGPARRAETPPNAPGSLIGPYRIIRELAPGGMGLVYQAVRADEVFRRVVALKVIRPGLVTDLLISVFQQERQILAQLDHPNIARIVDGGSTAEGLPYFVMDFVDGLPIDKFSRQYNLSITQRLVLFRQVCKATAYLHRNSIVHSDFKPSNIMVASDGTVKILDFGIARVVRRSDDQPHDGFSLPEFKALPVMTYSYASPEQLRGETPGFSSDIYSLGVVLYELLTGSRPYPADGLSIQELKAAITTQDPPPPSLTVKSRPAGPRPEAQRLEHSLRGDLDSILLQALRRQPAARYATVMDFERDLGNYLECRPVTARRAGPIYKVAKFTRRNRNTFITAFLVALLLGIAGWQALQIRHLSQLLSKDHRTIEQSQINGFNSISALAAARPKTPANGQTAVPPEFGRLQMNDLRSVEHSYSVLFPEAIHIWPGWTPQRHRLIDQAHEYLTQAEPLVANNTEATRELARAWFLVGNVEGDRHAPSLKDYTAAAKSFAQAQRLLSALLARNPSDEESRKLFEQVNSAADSAK